MSDKIAIYPGSFDPVTNGHIDIIKRSSRIFSKIIVAILKNYEKEPLFSVNERMELIKNALCKDEGIEITSFDGLLVDFAAKVNAKIIIRGLREISDFEYEFQMALMNRRLNENIETVFMMPKAEYSYLSSSLVREIATLDGNIKGLVPDNVREALLETLNIRKKSNQ